MKTENKIILASLIVVQLIALSMVASALTIDSISVSPESAKPGQDISVFVDLTNNENVDITNVAGNIDITNAPVKIRDISSASVDKIREDKTESIEFIF